MGIVDLLDQLPDSVCQPPATLWSVLARSLGEQGARGRTALAWRWALTGSSPAPVTLSTPTGRPPTRSELLAEAGAEAELSGGKADPGGQVMHARFVLQWLAGDLDALPLWNGPNDQPHVTDGAAFPRPGAEITDVHSRALLAQWRHPWPVRPSDSEQARDANVYARGIVQLLTWTSGADTSGPLTGDATAGPPSPYQVSVEVRHAMTGLEYARSTDVPILAARIEGIMDTFTWLAAWDTEPPVDRHGHLRVEDCPERTEPCGCDAAGKCLGTTCPACRRERCVHGFAQVTASEA